MKPAILGGDPAFDPPLAFARPTIEDPGRVLAMVEQSLASGMLTNGPLVRRLEETAADHFGARYCVAVASCTLGLTLVIQALDVKGPVALPSFTFSATAHAVRWNGLPPAFADCDPVSWTLRPEDVPSGAELIIGVHVSGVPCDVTGLETLAGTTGAALIFDAAHGAGSLIDAGEGPVPLGRFGQAEVFSLTPTKVLSGAEGGLVVTDDADLAAQLRIARDYGNPGDYDTRFAGLNARLSELHAALALASLDHLEARVSHRNRVADHYRELLGELPGVRFQHVPPAARSSYKDFTILLEGEAFGASRDAVVRALRAEGVDTRPYYSPPVHRQVAYREVTTPELPVTDQLANQVISLPIWSHLPLEAVERIGDAMDRIHRHADEVGHPG